MHRLLIVLMCTLVSAPAFGSFDFAPIIATLTPTGSGASASFIIQNADDTKLPVQVSLVHRDPDFEGKEDLKETPDIDDLFQIYPAQIILAPKEKRTVRITWIGDPKPKRELAFRMIAEELPIDLEENKTYSKPVAKVRIATKYVGSLYVGPAGARAQLMATAAPTEDKQPKLALEIQNLGTAHKVLANMQLKLTPSAGGADYEFSKTDLQSFNTQNVLAGKTRKFVMDWPKGFPVGPVKVALAVPEE